MSNTQQQPDAPRTTAMAHSPLEHRVMFVLFVLLALILFLPTILLPELRDYCLLLEEEVRQQQRVNELQTELERRATLVEAFRNDVVINERLAMIDLNYRKPGVEVLPLPPLASDLVASHVVKTAPTYVSELRIPATAPQQVRTAEAWAARHGLIALFLNPELKAVFLLMAGGLIVAAFVLFAPRMSAVQRGLSTTRSARTPASNANKKPLSSASHTAETRARPASAGPAA